MRPWLPLSGSLNKVCQEHTYHFIMEYFNEMFQLADVCDTPDSVCKWPVFRNELYKKFCFLITSNMSMMY